MLYFVGGDCSPDYEYCTSKNPPCVQVTSAQNDAKVVGDTVQFCILEWKAHDYLSVTYHC